MCAADVGEFIGSGRRAVGHPKAVLTGRVITLEQHLVVEDCEI
jgi:hypothetical protein